MLKRFVFYWFEWFIRTHIYETKRKSNQIVVVFVCGWNQCWATRIEMEISSKYSSKLETMTESWNLHQFISFIYQLCWFMRQLCCFLVYFSISDSLTISGVSNQITLIISNLVSHLHSRDYKNRHRIKIPIQCLQLLKRFSDLLAI